MHPFSRPRQWVCANGVGEAFCSFCIRPTSCIGKVALEVAMQLTHDALLVAQYSISAQHVPNHARNSQAASQLQQRGAGCHLGAIFFLHVEHPMNCRVPNARAGPLGSRKEGREIIRLQEGRQRQSSRFGVRRPCQADPLLQLVVISKALESDGPHCGVVGVDGTKGTVVLLVITIDVAFASVNLMMMV